MALNRNNLSVIGLVGMILTGSFFVHGPMILPSFGPQKKGNSLMILSFSSLLFNLI